MVRLAKWDTARPNHPGAEAEAGRSDGHVKSWGFPGKDMRQLSVAMCIEYHRRGFDGTL